MRWLLALLSANKRHELELEEDYTRCFEALGGMSPTDARKCVRNLIQRAKEQSTLAYATDSPETRGNNLPNDRILLERLHGEGVSEADIRWWWGLPDLDRRMFLLTDDFFRMTYAFTQIENGASVEQAAIATRKAFPIYETGAASKSESFDDRPLPCEIRARVNHHREAQNASSHLAFKAELDKFSSFNAYVRWAIRQKLL